MLLVSEDVLKVAAMSAAMTAAQMNASPENVATAVGAAIMMVKEKIQDGVIQANVGPAPVYPDEPGSSIKKNQISGQTDESIMTSTCANDFTQDEVDSQSSMGKMSPIQQQRGAESCLSFDISAHDCDEYEGEFFGESSGPLDSYLDGCNDNELSTQSIIHSKVNAVQGSDRVRRWNKKRLPAKCDEKSEQASDQISVSMFTEIGDSEDERYIIEAHRDVHAQAVDGEYSQGWYDEDSFPEPEVLPRSSSSPCIGFGAYSYVVSGHLQWHEQDALARTDSTNELQSEQISESAAMIIKALPKMIEASANVKDDADLWRFEHNLGRLLDAVTCPHEYASSARVLEALAQQAQANLRRNNIHTSRSRAATNSEMTDSGANWQKHSKRKKR